MSSTVSIPKLKKMDKRNTIPQIHSKIDSEHVEILEALNHLYDVCKKHWKTENTLFAKGIKKMSSRHENVKPDIQLHKKHHVECLNQIVDLKQQIVEHIYEEDVDHFHWLQ
jgi:hypothetical protein